MGYCATNEEFVLSTPLRRGWTIFLCKIIVHPAVYNSGMQDFLVPAF